MTATDATPSGSLQIEADLTVGLSASTLRVQSEDETLYIDAQSFEPLAELRAAADSGAVELLRRLGVDSPLAIETPVVVRVRGVPVGSYQPGQRVGRLAELVGTTPFKPRLRGVLRAAARRLRPSR